MGKSIICSPASWENRNNLSPSRPWHSCCKKLLTSLITNCHSYGYFWIPLAFTTVFCHHSPKNAEKTEEFHVFVPHDCYRSPDLSVTVSVTSNESCGDWMSPELNTLITKLLNTLLTVNKCSQMFYEVWQRYLWCSHETNGIGANVPDIETLVNINPNLFADTSSINCQYHWYIGEEEGADSFRSQMAVWVHSVFENEVSRHLRTWLVTSLTCLLFMKVFPKNKLLISTAHGQAREGSCSHPLRQEPNYGQYTKDGRINNRSEK